MNNENNNNDEKILITEEMIPMVSGNNEPNPIRIVVDEHTARCFLLDRGWNSMKIVILFDKPHPVWDDYFTTKYFDFIEPGKMRWGHEKESMRISKTLA